MPSKRSTIRATAATIALSLALAACGSGSSSSSTESATGRGSSPSTASKAASPPVSGKVTVAISNYSYDPPTITVAAGTKVMFANHDATAHTATSTAPGFDTATLKPGRTATVEFNKPGTYAYYCQFHAFMRGAIIVR